MSRDNNGKSDELFNMCFFFTLVCVEQFIGLSFAVFANQNKFVALGPSAVFVVTGLAAAVDAFADNRCVVADIHAHATIKDIELAFPQPVITERLAVLDDAAIDLVYVFEATLFHHGAEELAAHTTGTIADDFFVF